MTTDTEVRAPGLVLDLLRPRPVAAPVPAVAARRARLLRLQVEDVQRSAAVAGAVLRERRRRVRAGG